MRINVWSHGWIKGCYLRELIAEPLKPEENNLVVSNLHQNHEWKWEKLSFDHPRDIKDRIKAISMQFYGCREDSILWKHSKDGEFSTNLAYLLAIQDSQPQTLFQGHWIRKLNILPKIIHFF